MAKIAGHTLKHCNGLSNFLQTYIISLKYESPDDRVFIYPVVMVLMRSKSEHSYSKIFTELQKIKRFYNPESPNIYPTATSCDFEMAILKTLLKTLLPLHVPQVKFALVNNLDLLVEMISLSHRVAYRAMILDVQKRYLSASHRFSFTQAEHYHAILDGDTDCTSSSCESLNAKFNKTINIGFKSLVTVAENIKDFKKHYWENKLERMGENKMRQRPPDFVRRKNRLVELFREFESKTNREKALDLIPFILDISTL